MSFRRFDVLSLYDFHKASMGDGEDGDVEVRCELDDPFTMSELKGYFGYVIKLSILKIRTAYCLCTASVTSL